MSIREQGEGVAEAAPPQGDAAHCGAEVRRGRRVTMAAITLIREGAAQRYEDDGVRWLALLLRQGLLLIVAGIERRYGLGEKCPRPGHSCSKLQSEFLQ